MICPCFGLGFRFGLRWFELVWFSFRLYYFLPCLSCSFIVFFNRQRWPWHAIHIGRLGISSDSDKPCSSTSSKPRWTTKEMRNITISTLSYHIRVTQSQSSSFGIVVQTQLCGLRANSSVARVLHIFIFFIWAITKNPGIPGLYWLKNKDILQSSRNVTAQAMWFVKIMLYLRMEDNPRYNSIWLRVFCLGFRCVFDL